MRAAAVQMNSTDDQARNLASADRLVRRAAAEGAALVVLPEKWNRLGDPRAVLEAAETLDGPTIAWAREIASELSIDLVAGSILERIEGEDRGGNTSVHVGPDGDLRAVYRKIHLFDVEVGGQSYRESDTERPGSEIVSSQLADGSGVGLTVCYDIRFPELHRILSARGARVITVPAAFTVPTTRDQWEPLLRARAIENQCFLVAANQVGRHSSDYESGGRSMIVDPWGLILAQAPDEETVVLAELDFDRQDRIRASMPLMSHRRPDAYAEAEAVRA